jgi:hypothetical protein
VKKIFLAALILSSVDLLSLSFFTNDIFARTPPPFLPRLKTTARGGAHAAKMDLSALIATRAILAMDGELTPRSLGFFTVIENRGVTPRSLVVVRYFLTMIFAPKVSRYVANSALNI